MLCVSLQEIDMASWCQIPLQIRLGNESLLYSHTHTRTCTHTHTHTHTRTVELEIKRAHVSLYTHYIHVHMHTCLLCSTVHNYMNDAHMTTGATAPEKLSP